MTNRCISYLAINILILSCGQHPSIKNTTSYDSVQINKEGPAIGKAFFIDTNRVAVLSSEKIDFFGLKDSIPAALTNTDLSIADSLLIHCVQDHNKGLDSAKLYDSYIDLKNYKRQYIPYLNAQKNKNVFINCFCNGVDNSDKWKHLLLVVDDGGRCFFAVTINISLKTYSQLMINGPG